MVKVSFTEKEFVILRNHWIRNLNFGVGGTFGDGGEFTDEEGEKSISSYRIGQAIWKKLDKK